MYFQRGEEIKIYANDELEGAHISDLKRVGTGVGKFYVVTTKSAKNGLIKTIEIEDK